MLSPGAFLSVCDTPNRLWFHDGHTAFQNFYHGLPDDVAIDYAARTPRSGFNADFANGGGDDSVTRLARWGRGVSYHDFEIALDVSISDLAVDGEWAFRRAANAGRFHRLLGSIAPEIPEAFLEEEIAVMIRKR